MLRYVLAPLFVAMVTGEGCRPPDAFEGVVGLISHWIKDSQPHLMKGMLILHVNATLGKSAFEGELFVDEIKVKRKVILDYDKKTEYYIQNGKCEKKPFDKSLRPIPANAILVDNAYLGTGSENMAVKIYKHSVYGFDTYHTVTARDCIPVISALSGNIRELKVSAMHVMEYTDITVGIKDPSVFDVPTICHPVEMWAGYTPVFGHWTQSVFD